MNLGCSFDVKLFGATVLLGTVIFVNVCAPYKIKKGQGPDPKIMKIVPMIVCLSLVLVFLGIVITTAVWNRVDCRINYFLGGGFWGWGTLNTEVIRASLA